MQGSSSDRLASLLTAGGFGVARKSASTAAQAAAKSADASLVAQAEVEDAAQAEITSAALEAAEEIASLHQFLAERALPEAATIAEEAVRMRSHLAVLAKLEPDVFADPAKS